MTGKDKAADVFQSRSFTLATLSNFSVTCEVGLTQFSSLILLSHNVGLQFKCLACIKSSFYEHFLRRYSVSSSPYGLFPRCFVSYPCRCFGLLEFDSLASTVMLNPPNKHDAIWAWLCRIWDLYRCQPPIVKLKHARIHCLR